MKEYYSHQFLKENSAIKQIKKAYRKGIFIILILYSALNYSQINIRENIKTSPIDNSNFSKYDSIFDFQKQKRNVDYLKYIGQDLFLPPLEEKDSKGMIIQIPSNDNLLQFTKEIEYTPDTVFVKKELIGHMNGYYDNVGREMTKNKHLIKIKTDTYNPYISIEVDNPGYETIIRLGKKAFNKYYKIINITDERNNDLRKNPYNLNRIHIWLLTESKDTVIFKKELIGYQNALKPFIIKGFYEHELKRCKGKKLFVFKEEELNFENEVKNPFIDINTGEIVKITPNDTWLCEDISFLKIPGYSETLLPYYILKKDKNEIKIELDELTSNGFMTFDELKNLYAIWSLEHKEQINNEKEQIKQRHKECGKYFNKGICDKLIKGKIEIGMSTDMVLFSLGEPFHHYKLKTSSALKEIFYYGNAIIHFKNDAIEKIEEFN